MTTSRKAEVALLGAKTGNSGMDKTMTEYRKRLEAALAEATVSGHTFVNAAIQAQDLRSLLSEVDRYREALERASVRLSVLSGFVRPDEADKVIGWTKQARQALGENDV